MSRANFTISLPGLLTTQTDSSPLTTSFKSDCRYAAETTTGVSRRKPKGWIPPTGYSFTKREYTRAYGRSYVGIVKNNWSDYKGYVGNSGRFNSLNHFTEILSETNVHPDPTALKSASLVAARNKLKDMRVDLGTAFAERNATARMLGDTARRMADAARSLRRGEFRNAARALGIKGDVGKPRGSNWTNHWLQLQYGWKPLLSDIYGSADALSKRERSDWRVTAKAYRSTERRVVYNRLPGFSPSTGLPTNSDGFYGVAVTRQGVFTRIDAVPDNDLTMSLTSLGVTNPLNVAWELVPYSFVVDWVLPIGSWLSSLDAMLGYTSAYTSVSTRSETIWTDTGASADKGSPYTFVRNDWFGTKRLFELRRTAQAGVPVAAFPRPKDPRSLGHMANGLSLLAQAFGRR